ncbi:secreted protein containing DUF1549 [Rhodopirellula maiorica SM1]|uniref:Secreted protein containing DUF1549 n=1 Tax=Rhodopirellula maiorica SM1 TaxID=1265738 RepID=M5RLM4_9BACT|nr:DUF1549 and DUF1553 domain-containing protein [Rhodopirellula maiorica]EMI20106.1 secreted protein containing DUF1549 [Rhodopirellula maiorica SM1]
MHTILRHCRNFIWLACSIATACAPTFADDAPVSFELDIQPILTAHGCNSGACHGKQRGQNGFQLSLLGFDPEFDHAAVSRDARGRRIFPASPENSLLLVKATAESPHGGGRKIERNSEDYQMLTRWIRQGAPRRVEGEPTLERVTLDRDSFSLTPSETQSLRVTAHYSDDSTRDVTRLATYLSNDDAVVSVDSGGVIQAGSLPGETAVMARYMNHIEVANVVIPQTEPLPAAVFESLPRNGFIDELVYEKLQTLGIEPSPPVDDHVFLRRVSLDLIGRLPTVEEARAFLDGSESETPAERRAKLVDQLLERPEFADHWAVFWADLLRPNPYRVGIKAVMNYDNWIRQQFRDEVPYDTFVRQLVTAKGSTWQNGAATLYRDRRSPDEVATMVSQLFLGIRLDCAKCHHHPFERWSQQDFYQFAAYFAKVGRKGTGLSPPISGGEEVVYTSSKGSVSHPLTGETMTPTPLFEITDLENIEAKQASSGEPIDPREQLAQWMTSTDNDFFAKVHVNRTWGILMGRGLVEPVDDLRTTNPATNPTLLAELAKEFQQSGYDFKQLLKTITLSQVYLHGSDPTPSNVSDRLNYSRHYRRRLRAEVLADAVADVTQTTESFQAMPPDSRANQVWTTRVDSIFLDTFGRPNENQDPPCERTPDSTVTQALHLMNSQQLDKRIRSDSGRVASLAASEKSPEQIVDELYLATFTRYPTTEERVYAVDLITAATDRRSVIEDLMWAMLNAPEFSILN